MAEVQLAVSKHPWKTTKYQKVEIALGENLGAWLDAKRTPSDWPSWQDIAYDLRGATGLKVTHETCRAWWFLHRENSRQELES